MGLKIIGFFREQQEGKVLQIFTHLKLLMAKKKILDCVKVFTQIREAKPKLSLEQILNF